ncbi:MAG: ATP-binding cassette domain-containing protein [Candidatus Devosia euplotis]|nr:ATP-binding cassette domain-containing protein [Candidatus Devosia euplotis]
MSAPLLELSKVCLSFAGNSVFDNVDFTVGRGVIASLIGPNGAGKTSLFNCITGFYKPQSGSIKVDGQELMGLKPHKVTQAGIARTFQNVQLFRQMTVLENVMSGSHCRSRVGAISVILSLPASGARKQRSVPMPSRVWNLSALPTRWIVTPPIWPMAISGASRSPGHRPQGPSCCSMSPPPASMPAKSRICSI